MPRSVSTDQKRRELLPVVASCFAQLGYRRTTTAVLAERCGIRENVLYRLWRNKQQMFIAAVEFVFENSRTTWEALRKKHRDARRFAGALLAHESQHHGEFGYYRILFAGWSETDDAEIRAALARVYGKFKQFLTDTLSDAGLRENAELIAWAFLGLGTAANLGRELELLSDRDRQRLFGEIGQQLLQRRGVSPAA